MVKAKYLGSCFATAFKNTFKKADLVAAMPNWAKHTWDEFLPLLVDVVPDTVVSTGEDDGLVVQETQVIGHTFPQAEDVAGLGDHSSHVSRWRAAPLPVKIQNGNE